MKTIVLNSVNERVVGFTHLFKILLADLSGTADTTLVIPLLPLAVGDFVRDAAFYLPTPFDGGATSALKLDVGATDADGLLDNYEIHADGTEILAGDGNGAVFATLRTGHAAVVADTVNATFTSTGGNLSVLTTGEVWVYLNVVRLPDLG